MTTRSLGDFLESRKTKARCRLTGKVATLSPRLQSPGGDWAQLDTHVRQNAFPSTMQSGGIIDAMRGDTQ